MKTGMKTLTQKSLFVLGVFGILVTGAHAAYFDAAPAPRCDVQITRTLQTGSEGTEVTVLQNFLNRAGFLSVTPNGHFGPTTRTAVRAFQASNGISATGTVGPATRNAINERMCDTDLRGDSSSLYGGYSDGNVTYVSPHDPFVQVILPTTTTPSVYSTPGTIVAPSSYTPSASSVISPVTSYAPATTLGGTTNIVYSPQAGYLYGITPASGTLTITSPQTNTVYNEGDTVHLAWTTNNLSANGYTVLLENTSTNQSKAVTSTTGNSVSFVLTKDLLDSVCSGTCSNYTYGNTNPYQGSFRFVVTTPYRDLSGNVSTFRAAISPITIIRPYANFGTVSITASKTPVNSGEIFKLFVNIPTGAAWNANVYNQYSFKIKATCPSGTSATIAGVPCGQEFSIPFAPTFFQSEIPVMVGNSTWYRQGVTFTLTVTNLAGQSLGSSQTTVQVNGAPFSW